mgnify:CR=1 FL=1
MAKVFLELDDLKTVIENTVNLTLEKFKKDNPTKEDPIYLSRVEAAQLMNVCLSTLDKWSRRGKLRKHFLGKVVRYKKAEVLQALETLVKYQRK